MTGGSDLELIGRRTLHVVVDMQRVFAEATAWRVPSFWAIVPPILELAQLHPGSTVFTRFITPIHGHEAVGRWRNYYQFWRSVTLDKMDRTLLDLIEPFADMVPPAMVCDKSTYSAFESEQFNNMLSRYRPDTLILSGVETDVCVLATAYGAVDRGYRVIIPSDGVSSWSPAGHRVMLESVYPRLDRQIEIATAAEIRAAWGKA